MGAGRRSIHLIHCTWLKCSKMFIAVHFPWLPICYVSMFMVSSKLIDHGRGFCSRAVLLTNQVATFLTPGTNYCSRRGERVGSRRSLQHLPERVGGWARPGRGTSVWGLNAHYNIYTVARGVPAECAAVREAATPSGLKAVARATTPSSCC